MVARSACRRAFERADRAPEPSRCWRPARRCDDAHEQRGRRDPRGGPGRHGKQHESKTRLLDAALQVIRAKGYTATRIEDICEAAELTKGSFFHHFNSKEELALAAAEHWDAMTGGVFASAPYRALADPLDRLHGYVDFRKAILQGEVPEFTCLVGTMVQEVYATHPAIRHACDRSIAGHAAVVESDIAEAIRTYGLDPAWSAESLALHTQAVIQGAFVLAKARGGPAVAAACLDHLRRYLELLFNRPSREEKTS